MIRVQDWTASIPEEEKHIAYVGEGMSEAREFLLCGNGWEEYKDYSFHLDMEFDMTSITTRDSRQVEQTTVNSTKHTEETQISTEEVTTKEIYTTNSEHVLDYDETDVASLSKTVTKDGIRLVWTILRQHTQLPGKLWANIRAVGTDVTQIKKSAIMVFEVDASVKATPASAPPVSEFEQMEAEMDALRQQSYMYADEAMRHSVSASSAASGAVLAYADAAKAADRAEQSCQEAQALLQSASPRLLPVATQDDDGKILKWTDGAAVWTQDVGGSGENGSYVSQEVTSASVADGFGRHILKVSGVDKDTKLTVETTGSNVLCVGENLWPGDKDLTITYVKSVKLPFTLPAGGYCLSAKVVKGATGNPLLQIKNGSDNVSAGEYSVENGYTILDYNPSIKDAGNGRFGSRFFADSPFNTLTIFSANGSGPSSGVTSTFTDLCLVAVPVGSGTVGIVANECVYAGDYTGVICDADEPLTMATSPMYIIADDGGAITVSYQKTVYVSGGGTSLPPITEADEGKVLKAVGGAAVWTRDDKDDSISEDTLPDYWASYLPSKVDAINELIEQTALNGDAFIFITDQHLEGGVSRNAGHSTALIKYISDHTEVRRLFSGGDVCVTHDRDIPYVEGLQKAFAGHIHYVMGNHEYDMVGETERHTAAELFNLYDRHKHNQIGGSAARHYYYVDNPQQKMRYVVVNGWMHPSTVADDITQQATWLTNTAFKVDEGWGIIVFAHAFFDKYNNVEASATQLNNAINQYDGDGEIIAVFHGHQHWDMIRQTTGGVPVISTTCDKYMDTLPNGGEFQLTRTKGTITEHAFDVVIVDRTARKLHCVRIGAPAIDGNGAAGNPQVQTRVVDFRSV